MDKNIRSSLPDIVRIAVFIILVISGMTALCLGYMEKRTYSETEKRELKKYPPLTYDSITSGRYMSKLQGAVSDHIYGRDMAVSAKTHTEILLGTNQINGVYIDNDRLIGTYTDDDFDDSVIAENISYLSDFIKMVYDGLGKDKIQVMFIPSKYTVYKYKLPDHMRVSKKADTLYDMISKKSDIFPDINIDIRNVMNKHKDEYIYYLTDHHWTSLGAGYAYDAWRKYFYKNTEDNKYVTEDIKDIPTEVVSDDFLGTDYNKIQYYQKKDTITRIITDESDSAHALINESGKETKKDTIYSESDLNTADKYNYFLGGNYDAVTIHTSSQNKKTLLLIKDSYSNSLIPYLCRDFQTIVMVDLRYTNSSIFDYLKKVKRLDDVIIAYNEDKFMQDTHQYMLQ